MSRKERLALVNSAFRVGLPSNEINQWAHPYGKRFDCLCAGDYSGDDPNLQFPEGWHCVAGDGLDNAEYRTWRVHQDCAVFEPWRIKVAAASTDNTFPLDPYKRDTTILRLLNGGESPYSARLSKYFAKVDWELGVEVVYIWWFMFDLSYAKPLYANFEGRGALVYNQHSDPNETQGTVQEFLSAEITEQEFRARWWHNPSLAGKMTGRQLVKLPIAWQPHAWYKLRVHYKAVAPQYNWDTNVLIRDTNAKTILRWRVPQELRIDTGMFLNQIYFGDERGRDSAGGKWFFTAPRVERLFKAQAE